MLPTAIRLDSSRVVLIWFPLICIHLCITWRVTHTFVKHQDTMQAFVFSSQRSTALFADIPFASHRLASRRCARTKFLFFFFFFFSLWPSLWSARIGPSYTHSTRVDVSDAHSKSIVTCLRLWSARYPYLFFFALSRQIVCLTPTPPFRSSGSMRAFISNFSASCVPVVATFSVLSRAAWAWHGRCSHLDLQLLQPARLLCRYSFSFLNAFPLSISIRALSMSTPSCDSVWPEPEA